MQVTEKTYKYPLFVATIYSLTIGFSLLINTIVVFWNNFQIIDLGWCQTFQKAYSKIYWLESLKWYLWTVHQTLTVTYLLLTFFNIVFGFAEDDWDASLSQSLGRKTQDKTEFLNMILFLSQKWKPMIINENGSSRFSKQDGKTIYI